MTNLTFHIGMHKTATTWLQHIFYPQHKQIHNIVNSASPWNDRLIFDLVKSPENKFDLEQWRNRAERRILNLNLSAKDRIILSAERLSGHPANGGIDRFRIARRMHRVAPQGKVLCVFRNQTDMIPSLYRTMVNEGFSGDINDMMVDRSWKTVGPNPFYFEYDLLVNEYQALFGKEMCLFLCFEHMLSDPKDFIRRICRFIGVDPVIPAKSELQRKVNTGFPRRSLGLFRHLNAYRKTEYNPYLPISLPSSIFKGLVKCVRRVRQPKAIMTDHQIATIKSMYADSNERLAQLLDKTMAKHVQTYSA